MHPPRLALAAEIRGSAPSHLVMETGLIQTGSVAVGGGKGQFLSLNAWGWELLL